MKRDTNCLFQSASCTPFFNKFSNMRLENENLFFSWLAVKVLYERTYQLPLSQSTLHIAPYSRQAAFDLGIWTVKQGKPKIESIFLIFLTGALWRSSHRWCSIEKDVLRNFEKLTGKHLCRSLLFLIKLQAWDLRFSEKESPAQVFSC